MKKQWTRRFRAAQFVSLFAEPLEDRFALDGTPWSSFAGNAQNTSLSDNASQALEAVHWSAPVDNFPTSRAAHYGGPIITANNTVIYPFKVGDTTTPDFHIVARNGNDGSLVWDIATEFSPIYEGWYPPLQPVLATATNRVYYPGKGGTIFYRDNPDSSSGSLTQVAFWGPLSDYLNNQATYDANVVVDTALKADSQGNIYFGFRVLGANPANLVSGIARITPAGVGTWVSAQAATNVGSGVDGNIDKVAKNVAFALSNDEQSLYVVVARTSTQYYGRLLKLNATTLATQARTGVLKDPRNTNNAGILSSSTASPMVAPDGRVFLGVFANPYNGSRGWMLQFSGDLATQYTSGGFGWDTTPSIVPASMIPQYTGSSPYLIFTKYNNYYGITNGGDGSNMIAILDPNDTEVEFHPDSNGQLVMKRVLFQVGPTPDWDYPNVPTAVREWCINYGAVDPATNSVIVNSADGKFYRWHLPTDSFTEEVRLTSGIGQPYTMTVIGVDGTVYGIQIGTIFAMGQTPRMSIGDAVLSEGTGGQSTATFTVSLNYPRTQAISVAYATADGTALAGSDYTATSGTLTFLPGEKSKTISVPIDPDALYELNETFSVNLSNVDQAVLLDAQGLGTLVNDDAVPTIVISNVSQNEGNSGTTNFVFTVSLSAASGVPASVAFQTAHGTAQTTDYTGASGTVSFQPGVTSRTITVLVNGDTTFEPNETFFVNLNSPVNAGIADGQGVGSIINDDAVPAISIGDVTITEGGIAVIQVSLSNSTAQTVTVNYVTSNRTAVAGLDYTAQSGQLNFELGLNVLFISLPTTNDSWDEAAEQFAVELSNPVNGFIVDGEGLVTINDNDPTPTVSIGDVTLNEGAQGATAFEFVVSVSAPSGRQITVDFATADNTASASGGDYSSATGQITFAPGATQQIVTIQVQGDTANEPSETFFVNLLNPINVTLGDGQGVGTIVNDDNASVTIGDVALEEGNSGATSFVFTLSLNAPQSQVVSVNYATVDGTATAGIDYTAGSGTVVFQPGQTTQNITVEVQGDGLNEADETFFVDLSQASGATLLDAQGLGTILNDDAAPLITLNDFSVPELDYNTGTVNVFVYLSAPSEQTITVDFETSNGTASSTSADKDYIDTFGTLTFLPGQTIAAFEVSIVGDTRAEPNETIRVLLSNPTQAEFGDDLGIITILDDDLVYVTITGTSIVEGDSGTQTATVRVDLSTVADYDLTIDYQTVGETATAGVDFLATQGTLTFLPGILTQDVQVQVIGDLVDELDEVIEVLFSNATVGVVLGNYPSADIEIADDDLSMVRIDDVQVAEGNSGTTAMQFAVSLSGPSDRIITVRYATADGTALAPGDYQAATGTLTFAPGETSKNLPINVQGDTTPEPNETFHVNLSNATGGAVFADSTAVGTILNDDLALSINDVAQIEGQFGWTSFVFTVSLPSPAAQTVTVQYGTADGTAQARTRDYEITNGTLTFDPGTTSRTIAVRVRGEKLIEADETFLVRLKNAVGAVVGDSDGLGTILNDDGLPRSGADASFTANSPSQFPSAILPAEYGQIRSALPGPGDYGIEWKWSLPSTDAVPPQDNHESVKLQQIGGGWGTRIHAAEAQPGFASLAADREFVYVLDDDRLVVLDTTF